MKILRQAALTTLVASTMLAPSLAAPYPPKQPHPIPQLQPEHETSQFGPQAGISAQRRDAAAAMGHGRESAVKRSVDTTPRGGPPSLTAAAGTRNDDDPSVHIQVRALVEARGLGGFFASVAKFFSSIGPSQHHRREAGFGLVGSGGSLNGTGKGKACKARAAATTGTPTGATGADDVPQYLAFTGTTAINGTERSVVVNETAKGFVINAGDVMINLTLSEIIMPFQAGSLAL